MFRTYFGHQRLSIESRVEVSVCVFGIEVLNGFVLSHNDVKCCVNVAVPLKHILTSG